MNFKLKALFAATVLAASATSANAAIDGGNTTNGSEFVFSAWDINTGVGYTLDLNWNQKFDTVFGTDLSTTAANNTAVLNNAQFGSSLIGAGGVIYDDVLTGIPFGANIANVQWNLTSLDNAGRTRLVTTKDSADEALFTAITNNGQKAGTTILNGYYAASNSFTSSAADDTFAITSDANANAFAGTAGSTYNLSLFDTTNALGGTSSLYFLAQATQASSAAPALAKQLTAFDGANIVVSTYQQAGQWRLNLSAVPVAAVPEPETYAMFLAGLGIMGAVARRRKGQVK